MGLEIPAGLGGETDLSFASAMRKGREEPHQAPSVAKLPPHLKGCKSKGLGVSKVPSKPCQIMHVKKMPY
jgi:hypothetical protein